MRIYASDNTPFDFCQTCALTEESAQEIFGLDVFGEGPDGRGDCFAHDAEHPHYEDDEYYCESCGTRLTRYDN